MHSAFAKPLPCASAWLLPRGRTLAGGVLLLAACLAVSARAGPVRAADGAADAALAGGAPTAQRTIAIVATGDLKGRITATAPGDRPGRGLAHLARPLAELRARHPSLVLLDSGDALAGSPPAETDVPDAMPLLMNRLGYAAMALGNQDFLAGPAELAGWRGATAFPWLAANLTDSSGQPAFPPYHVVTREGVRIGILGLTNPALPAWSDPARWTGLRIQGLVAAARHWVPILRERERADVVVALVHAGTEADYDEETSLHSGLPRSNAAGVLADVVPDMDLVISGHAHRLYPRYPLNGPADFRTPIIRSGAYGEALAVAELRLRRQAGRWRVADVHRYSVPAAAAPDPALLTMAAPSLAAQRAWLDVPLGVRLLRHPRSAAFHRCTGELGHHAVLRWQARAGKEIATPTTLSLLPGLWHLDASALPPAGAPLRRGHLWQWLPYDNRLLLATLFPRQVGLLLQDYADHQRERRVRYAGVLYPGGMRVALKGGGLPAPLTMAGAPWPPGKAQRVWLTGYHAFGGAGLAPRALLHPSQRLLLSPMRHRDAVEALLRDRKTPLPSACEAFLARDD